MSLFSEYYEATIYLPYYEDVVHVKISSIDRDTVTDQALEYIANKKRSTNGKAWEGATISEIRLV